MKAANTMEVRQQNASYILHDIECNPGITNAEIAKQRGLSVPTISNIVNILKGSSMIMAASTGESSGGRRPFQLSLYPEYQNYIGVSIAKHTVYLVWIDFAGKIHEQQRKYVEFADSREYWQRIAELILALQERTGMPCRVGLALPGFVDQDRNKAWGIFTLDVWEISLDDLSEILANPVTAGDSCTLAGVAQIFGKSNYGDSFFILLSRRISGILIREKEIFRLQKSSLDVGSMIVDPSCNTSDYGIPGSFLELCTASRIIDQARACTEVDTLENFFEELGKGNRELAEIWDAYLKNLSIALHNIYAVFGVDIVIGGEMATYIEPFAKELGQHIRAITPKHPRDMNLHFSAYGKYDDAFGAALEARSSHIKEQLPVILRNAAASVAAQPKTGKSRRKR